jgi:hypothetical protein
VTAAQYLVTPDGANAVYNIVNATSTYAGLYIIQAGGGSAGFGGGLIMYGHSHASKAGWVTAGISANSGGKFSVNTQGSGGGTDIFTVDPFGNTVVTGNLTVDTNTLFVDATNNRVGIGTASPTQQFEIYSDSYNRFYTTYPDSYTSRWNVGINAYIQQDAINEEFRIAQLYGTGKITFLTSGGEKMRITSGGDVGIGTTAPAEKLDVFGRIQARPLANGSSGNYWYMIGSITDVTNFGVANGIQVESSALNSYAMTFGTQTTYLTGITEKMRITSAGNVGIGTSAPAYKLDVNGSQRWIFRNTSAEITDLLISTESANSVSKLSLLWYGNETASLKFHRGGDSTGGAISLWTQPESGTITERIRITTPGNVGIGTSNPNHKLDVNGHMNVAAGYDYKGGGVSMLASDGSAVYLKIGTQLYIQTGATVLATIASTGAATFNNTVTATQYIVGSGTTSSDVSTLYKTDTGDFSTVNIRASHAFGISDNLNSAYRIYINSSGNVGIGNTNPTEKLHVTGNLKLAGDAIVGVNGAGAIGTLQIQSSGSSPIGNRLLFGTDGTGWQFRIGKNQAGTISDLVYIHDDGRFSIGSNISTSKFTVSADGNSLRLQTATNPIDYYVTINSNYDYANAFSINANGAGGVQSLMFWGDSAGLTLQGGASRKLIMQPSNGNVIIGSTTDTTQKLQVTGTAKITGTTTIGSNLLINGTSIEQNDSNGLTINASNASGAIYFRTAGSEKVVIKSTGQVRFNPLASDPSGQQSGDVYYNSTSNVLKYYNGTTWNDMAVSSSTYTPTLTAVTNVSSSTASVLNYFRNGSMVHIIGKVTFTATAAGTTRLGISLPIASNFTTNADAVGFGDSGLTIISDITNDRLELEVTATSTLSTEYGFMVTYVIK